MLVDLAAQRDDLVGQAIGCLRYSLELGHGIVLPDRV
jgi:hypothetical protein